MSMIQEVIGLMVMALGLLLMTIGLVGLFKFKNFYARILVVSKVDTVGIILFMFGVMIREGISFFSGKVFLIVIITLLLGPLVGHMIARSAYLSNYNNLNTHNDDSKSLEGDGL